MTASDLFFDKRFLREISNDVERPPACHNQPRRTRQTAERKFLRVLRLKCWLELQIVFRAAFRAMKRNGVGRFVVVHIVSSGVSVDGSKVFRCFSTSSNIAKICVCVSSGTGFPFI